MFLKYYITLSNSELLINCIPNLENINYNNENDWTNFVLKNNKNYYFNSIYNLEFYNNSNYSEASKIQISNILNDYVLEVDENYVMDFGEWIYYKLLDNTNEILGKFKVVSDNNIPDVLVEIGTSYKEGSFSGNDDVISIDSFLGDITNNITQTQQQIPNPQVLGIYKSIWNSNDGYNSETIDKTVRVIDTIPPEIYIQFKVTVSSITTSNTRNNINKFLFDGLKPWENDNIVLKNGLTYYFDQSDISNSSHPLLFSYDGTENGQGTVVSTRNGVPGTPGAWTKLEVANNQTSIYYYCLNHYLMGDELYLL